MFMLRMFQGAPQPAQPDHKVVDVASPSPSGQQLNLKHNAQSVIAVSDRDDGFADVAIRPLTYAEVASLTANDTARQGEAGKVYVGDIADYEEDQDADDSVFDDNEDYEENDLLADSSYSVADIVDEEYEAETAETRVYLRRPSNDVLGELEYGERAKQEFVGFDRKVLAKKHIMHQTPLVA